MNNYEMIKAMIFNADNSDNIRLYHGTTSQAIRSIVTDGFKYTGESIWNCSDDEFAYFWEFERMIKVEDWEDDSFDTQQRMIISRANESAQIQQAMLDSPGNYTYVLELIVPPEFVKFIKEDDSCDYMYGAVQIRREYINLLFKTGQFSMHIYKCPFSPKCSLMYVTGMIDNPHFICRFTEYEEEIINVLRSSSIFIEELLDPDIIYDETFGKSEFKIYND